MKEIIIQSIPILVLLIILVTYKSEKNDTDKK